MLVLKPIRHDTLWGGSRITNYTGIAGNSIGHLYSLFCRREMSNEILNGQFAGKTMNESFPLWKHEVGMGEYSYFPLTLALTEADLNLSVQVHPNDIIANTIEGKSRGKRESWYFIEPPTDGYIINGCVCKSETEKENMINEGKYLEMCDKLNVVKGDYVFVEPGTLHSITAGSLVYEIEEGGDFTYRFYDYNRVDENGKRRELHIDKARKALDIRKKSVTRRYQGDMEIIEKTYATKMICERSRYKNNSDDLECFTLISGEAICDRIEVSSGMTVLLWPRECIDNANIELAFVARQRRDV